LTAGTAPEQRRIALFAPEIELEPSTDFVLETPVERGDALRSRKSRAAISRDFGLSDPA
jgi:hypothetical protein